MPQVAGMELPLLKEETASKIRQISAMRSELPLSEKNKLLDERCEEIAEDLLRTITSTGRMDESMDLFAYFRIRMDALKLMTFIGYFPRVMSAITEGKPESASFWSSLSYQDRLTKDLKNQYIFSATSSAGR